MAEEQSTSGGPDLSRGVMPTALSDGKLLGHVGDQEVLLVRVGEEVLAIDAHCSHYHGPLADGLVVGDTVRCPWLHACFDLRSGEARSGTKPAWPLEGRTQGWTHLRSGADRAAETGP
jgi:nitrite reductase/ring-hydroxylating ferredoxin subunit